MTYYAFINPIDNSIGKGECPCSGDNIICFEITEDIYNHIEKYIYSDGELVENPNYEAEQAQKERERLDMLTLTAADVERAIYKAKGMDFDDIVELVKDNPIIDIKALKIELKANNFYRGNPYINQIGTLLGYSSEDLDYLFVNKSLPEVITPSPTTEEKPDNEPVTDDVTVDNEEA